MSDYACDNGIEVSAKYHPDAVNLSIDGVRKDLYQTVLASGSKYATENGITPETGLIWWIKGDEVTMFEMVLDHSMNTTPCVRPIVNITFTIAKSSGNIPPLK